MSDTYVPDGTEYTSDEINTRTAKLTSRINALTKQELAHGAFRTEHLPSPIGIAGKSPGSDTYSRSVADDYAATYGAAQTYKGIARMSAPMVTFSEPISFRNKRQAVNAVIVLANVQIAWFLDGDGYKAVATGSGAGGRTGHLAFEDAYQCTFSIGVENTVTGEKAFITDRTTSPGWTVCGVPNQALVQSAYGNIVPLKGDTDSYKDVAIRTVIRSEDVDFAFNRVFIRVQTVVYPAAAFWTAGGSNQGSIVVPRATLTAIPLQCKVSDE